MKGSIENIENIQEYIKSRLVIRNDEKNKFGEVLTPPNLIEEILDEFPSHIWKNADIKWVDPAAGTGNYFALVYSRYMKSLTSQFPNKTNRSNHIIENMLYMVELNANSVKSLRELFGKSANISKGDFLEIGSKIEPDIIIGNPPFQVEKTEAYEGSSGHRTLWDKFVKKSLDILKPNGYLAFITPANWRRPESDLYELMAKQNQLLFLHIYSKKDGMQQFGVETRFDNYLIQKTAASKDSKIVDELGKELQENVESWPFLPNYEYPLIRSMLTKTNGISVIFDSSFYYANKLKSKHTVKYKYPVIHTITKSGLGLKYADKANADQIGVKKVVLNFNENQYPHNDFQGKYGMSQITFGIPISSKKEGERWVQYINGDVFKRVIKATKWSSFQTDYRMFRFLDRNIINKNKTRSKRQNNRKTRRLPFK
jgi:SAM-dependent methyltransferase